MNLFKMIWSAVARHRLGSGRHVAPWKAASCRRTPYLVLALLPASLFAETREPWTTSNISGSPEPPPLYIAEPVWPELELDRKLDIAHLKEAHRIILVGQKGKILSLPDDPTAKLDSYSFADLGESIPNLTNVYGLTFQSRSGKTPLAYVFYTRNLPKTQDKKSYIARFQTAGKPLKIVPDSREDLISFGAGGHNGGHLQFGPDGMLYISIGDLEVPAPPDTHRTGQDISDLPSSILRIDVNKTSKDKPYSIPKDNPFIDHKGARPEVWAYGLRNPWKLCFHPQTGDLWTGDVGWETWEMLHKIERGGNYGWSLVEGPKAINVDHNMGPTPILPPVIAYSHYEGASITGGYVYEDCRLPKLKGKYIYGDYVTGRIWAMDHDGEKLVSNEKIADTRERIVTFGQAANGEVLFLNWPKAQTLFRLIPNPNAGKTPDFPRKLSETGLFASTSKEKPSAGVYDYEPLATLWQDGATAKHYIAVPDSGSLTTEFHNRRGSNLLRHGKPNNTVFAKTIRLNNRKVETQVLHFDGFWKGYTYRWNEAQTDANLVPAEGQDAIIEGQPWRFHSREECMRCHGGNFNHVYGFAPGQLNHKGQIQRFQKLKIVDSDFEKAAREQPTANPYDKTAKLETRARSWLNINCAHCHRISGGSGVNFYLNIETPTDQMALSGIAPTKGHFNLDNPALIQPGYPFSSTLYFRTASTGIGHMPMLGNKTIDKEGLKVVHDWIKSMKPSANRDIPETISSPSDALQFAHLLDTNQLSCEKKEKILEAARKSQSVEVQGIFQRFLNEE